MNTIQLTPEHEARLRSMCRALFPEYTTYQILFDADGILTFRQSEGDMSTKFRIHWFELCMNILAKRIFYNKTLKDTMLGQPYLEAKLGYLLRDTVLIGIHPVDYLYLEAKTLL